MPTQLEPGPDHPIHLTAAPGRVRATYQGHVLADSADVLMLKEASYPAVAYFPRDDVEMAYMGRTDKTTHCPYKGDASYYTLRMDSAIDENAVWTYESPYPAMEAIRDRLAFYPNIVTVTFEAARSGEVDPSEVVRHTDSGSGASQGGHWAANTDGPGSGA